MTAIYSHQSANYGTAMGFSVVPARDGFRWSAWGPRGSESGEVSSRGEADALARQAYARLGCPTPGGRTA